MNTGIKTCILKLRLSLYTRRPSTVAFTLIELLIVISIMAILVSMLSAMMSIAQRQGRITNTRATMMKVDQAIRLFKTDMRIYPWQSDLGLPPAEPALWTNNLAKRLAWHPPAPADATASDPDRVTYIRKFQEDLATIEGKFRFVNGANVPPSGDSSEGTHAFRYESGQTNLLLAPGTLAFDVPTINGSWWRNKLIPGIPGSSNDCSGDARALTKMAEEVTKQAYTAGQLPTLAPTGIDATLPADKALFPNEDERYPTVNFPGTSTPYRYLPYNKSGYFGNDARGPVLATATAKAEGWRGEYLTDAIRRDGTGGDHVDVDATGTALLDAWGKPFIYVSSVRPGVRGGVQALTTTIFPIVIEQRYNMGPQGRTTTTSLTSDIRTTAAPSQIYEFELWSAGPDGAFAATRSDPVNRDNIAVVKYLGELQ
jgi:prepilin-type N-terminal cleavage/methylation domain-containing protein